VADHDLRTEIDVFMALVRAEPGWRHATLDHGDRRPGGYVAGDDVEEGERLTCANHHTAAEVGLPCPEVHAFVVASGPGCGDARLSWVRRIRAEAAAAWTRRQASREPTPERQAIDFGQELARSEAVRDDVAPAVALLRRVLESLPGPWELTRVLREPQGGALCAFGLTREGDLVVGSLDLEARQLGAEPALAWMPPAARGALAEFLEFES
jgi:hypothetical protein